MINSTSRFVGELIDDFVVEDDRLSQVEEDALSNQENEKNDQEVLRKALKEVAAALNDDRQNIDPFEVIRHLCHSPASSPLKEDSSRNHSFDNDDEKLLMQVLGRFTGHDHSMPDDLVGIDPVQIAIEKIQPGRHSLAPDFHAPSRPMIDQMSPGPANSAASRIEVDMPLLPPALGGTSPTPLHEKEPKRGFKKKHSTPPIPVKGAPDRQRYLEQRESTQPIAMRLKSNASPPPDEFQILTTADAEDLRPVESQSSSPRFGESKRRSDARNEKKDDEAVEVTISAKSRQRSQSPLSSVSKDELPPRSVATRAAVKSRPRKMGRKKTAPPPKSNKIMAQATLSVEEPVSSPAQANSDKSPTWNTPRPAPIADLPSSSALEAQVSEIIDDSVPEEPHFGMPQSTNESLSIVLADDTVRRVSAGVQASYAIERRRGGRKAANNASNQLELPKEVEGRLRRISICEVSTGGSNAPEGKVVRQRSKRIRIEPLKWWAGEHIEYQGSIHDAKATAIYKIDPLVEPLKKPRASTRASSRRDSAEKSRRKKPDTIEMPAIEDRVEETPAPPQRIVDLQHLMPKRTDEDVMWVDELVRETKNMPRSLQTYMTEGSKRLARLNESSSEWTSVTQNGFSYRVKLMMQTIRNTSVQFRLEGGTRKGPDQTRSTQMLLNMEMGEVEVETRHESMGSEGEWEKTRLKKSGDWCIIPSRSHYDVRNVLKNRAALLTAHVVACDNNLFRKFINS